MLSDDGKNMPHSDGERWLDAEVPELAPRHFHELDPEKTMHSVLFVHIADAKKWFQSNTNDRKE